MIRRFTPPFRPEIPPQWRGACAAVAGGGPNRATAISVARLAFTIAGASVATGGSGPLDSRHGVEGAGTTVSAICRPSRACLDQLSHDQSREVCSVNRRHDPTPD
jgi:hypothetical protein